MYVMIDLECNMFSSTTPYINHYPFDKSVNYAIKINLSKNCVLARHAFFTEMNINLYEFNALVPSTSPMYYNRNGFVRP